MKEHINEAKRLQQLAGILTESPDMDGSIAGGIDEVLSVDTTNAYNAVIELDSPDMEVFLKMLSDYFRRNVEGLQNMDATKIADHLQSAHDLVKSRSGN